VQAGLASKRHCMEYGSQASLAETERERVWAACCLLARVLCMQGWRELSAQLCSLTRLGAAEALPEVTLCRRARAAAARPHGHRAPRRGGRAEAGAARARS